MFTSKQTYVDGATAGFNAIIMSQSIALFAGALGVGVSSIAYYISSSKDTELTS